MKFLFEAVFFFLFFLNIICYHYYFLKVLKAFWSLNVPCITSHEWCQNSQINSPLDWEGVLIKDIASRRPAESDKLGEAENRVDVIS